MKKNSNKESYSSNSILMSELEEQELSDYCWKLAIMDAKNDGFGEGKKIGIDEGKKIGIDEGKKIGIAEGNMEIAKKLINRGCSIQFISECTDLSIDQINEIIKNCNND